MKIVYIARFGQAKSNDDEGAIAHGFRELGHEVMCIHEKEGFKALRRRYDLCLFNHYSDMAVISQLNKLSPVAFWYFDLVDWSRDSARQVRMRSQARIAWMQQVTPYVTIGFCTDGDWVRKNTTGNLVHLCQGADNRVTGVRQVPESTDILFTGITRGGEGRMSWVKELKQRYGERFVQVPRLVHGEELGKLIASAKVVVAPDAPFTNFYWSNRVYLTLGFGGFLLHPFSSQLAKQYLANEEIVYYYSRDDLYTKIDHWLDDELAEQRRHIQGNAYARTMRQHTYTHRCETLLQVCKEQGVI